MSHETLVYTGFTDGANHHTEIFSPTAWVSYSPFDQLVVSGGAYLWPMTNNMVEYNVVIEILCDVIINGIFYLEFHLDSQQIISYLNGKYQVCDPMLFHHFFCVRLLQRQFIYIVYNHVPRRKNIVTYAYANYVLD